MIGDVRTVVSWDLDYSDGELAEAELAFYAQDDDGNVWRMGEYPEEYDGGQIVDAPTWIHGIADARAGIHLQASPQPGTPSYAQGWGPAVDWTDRGQVDQMDQQICVPLDCYEGVLVIAETSQAESDAQQLKYYAPGVGNVHVRVERRRRKDQGNSRLDRTCATWSRGYGGGPSCCTGTGEERLREQPRRIRADTTGGIAMETGAELRQIQVRTRFHVCMCLFLIKRDA